MKNVSLFLKVSQGDGFPNLMCVQCVLQCSRAYTFKQLCEKSDNILRQYLSPEFQVSTYYTVVINKLIGINLINNEKNKKTNHD